MTCLTCAVSLVSLGRAIGIEVGSQQELWSDLNGPWPLMGIAVVWLAWGVILLVPVVSAGWMAYVSRASLFLGAVPLLLSTWILVCVNGFQLMVWQTVRASRPHGMSFSFELSLLGIVYLWPAAVLCLALWVAARAGLRRRAARAASANPALQGTHDRPARP
jgi:hypothetical protein